ncbi:MAG: type I-MYXAN CRISPR-associated Cas8a1/Cmx1 [Gloeomargaritaceae cyanobacterium C42_A2020_066]|nr:type I-MYXAN CRISPR-associated Cas8a1/Cmx1 [Gloeomargaritaceae cyanobacterium C42_A2020_066]
MTTTLEVTRKSLILNLGDSHFTILHRAGLAGLWMTLAQLEREGVAPPEGLTWELTPQQVSLKWAGHDKTALDWLLRESFQLKDGLICLRGLDSGSMRLDVQVVLHQGMLGTFLQHPSTRKAEGKRDVILKLDEDDKELKVSYLALQSYVHTAFAESLCDKKGEVLTKPLNVAGWLNPGATVKHIAFSADTGFKESAVGAFVLLFAPVACGYYLLRSQLRGQRAQFALVIPDVQDLECYSRYRNDTSLRNASYKDFQASSLGDAGLQFLTYEQASERFAQNYHIPRCQVITLGSVVWASQQKTRTDLFVIEADHKTCQQYRTCRSFLDDRTVQGKEGNFIAHSFAREIITENLARGLPWYNGFAKRITSNDLFKKLTFERGGLHQMIQHIEWDNQAERLFVQACHEAIRYTYGQIAEQAKNRNEVPNFDRETVRIRTGLGRCKTSQLFREFITDFFARAGKVPTLQEHWRELINLITGKDWSKARDLALLALASYKGKETEGMKALETEDDEIMP